MTEVKITPYQKKHYKYTVEMLNIPSIQSSFGRTGDLTLKQHTQWILSQNARFFYAIYYRDEYIGNIFYFINETHKSACFEIYIHPKVQGKGIGTHSIILTMNKLFQSGIIHRLWLRVLESNSKAISIYKKIGFKYEGLERESYYNGKFFENHAIYSLLSYEWREKY